MYSLGKDSRSTESMIALRNALVTCMRTKSLQDVTVSDLSRIADVSRVTFYNYFSTPADVLEFLCDSIFDEAADVFKDVDRDDHDEYLRLIIAFLMGKSDFLDTIFRSRRIDLFQRSFNNYIDQYLPDLSGMFSRTDEEYAVRTMTAAFASIIFAWAEKGKKETAEDLMRVIRECERVI